MKVKKTVYKPDLLPAESYTIRCGDRKREFKRGEEKKAGAWLLGIWEEEKDEFFSGPLTPAYVYYNIGWDADDILYCKYEAEG